MKIVEDAVDQMKSKVTAAVLSDSGFDVIVFRMLVLFAVFAARCVDA